MSMPDSSSKPKRQLKIFRKQQIELEHFPDFPEDKCSNPPQPIAGEVTLKEKKKRRWSLSRKYFAELQKGMLKLYKNREQAQRTSGINMNMEFKIETDKVPISGDGISRRFHLHFKKETQIMTPVDTSTYPTWRDAFIKHRLYRQEQIANGNNELPVSEGSDPQEHAPSTPQSTITTATSNNSTLPPASPSGSVGSDHIRVVEGLGAITRVMDEMKEMYNMTIEVSEKTVRTCERLQRTADEMKGVSKEMKDLLRTIRTAGISAHPQQQQDKEEPQQNVKRRSRNGAPEADDGQEVRTAASTSNGTVATAETITRQEDSEEEEEEEEEQKNSGISSLYSTKEPSQMENQKNEIIERGMNVLKTKSVQNIDVSAAQQQQQPAAPHHAVAAPAPAPKPVSTGFTVPRMRRPQLPAKQLPGECMGLRDFAKMAVTRSGIPISNYEPLSMVQVMCEELRYNHMLTGAAQQKDPGERMLMIAAFAVSGYSNTFGRGRKPFNPIHGETFDYVEPDWRFHGEQVSHHPPITAGYAEGRGWTWWQTEHSDSSVGKLTQTIEVTHNHPVRIRLVTPMGGEEYAIDKVKTVIEKATDFPEKRKISHLGKMRFRCTNGLTAELNFKDRREIVGDIYAQNKAVCYRVQGQWDTGLYKITSTGEQVLIFQPLALPDEQKNYYGLSRFAVTLNEILAGDRLPPTDSRLRPDQKALELGQGPRATSIKKHLEEAQRRRPKYVPLWFEQRQDQMSQSNIYVPNMKYWPAKDNGFSGVNFVNIFPLPN